MTTPEHRNPLVDQAAAKVTSWRTSLVLAALFLLVTASLVLLSILEDPQFNLVAIRHGGYDFTGENFSWVFMPLIVGMDASVYLARMTRSEMHTLLLVSGLSYREIVRGYIHATISQMRLLWAMWIGIGLPMMFGLIYWLAICDGVADCTAGEIGLNVLKTSVYVIGWAGMILSMTALALTTALAAALTTRRRGATLAITLITVAVVAGGSWALTQTPLVEQLARSMHISPGSWIVLDGAMKLALALVIAAISTVLYLTSHRWLRVERLDVHVPH